MLSAGASSQNATLAAGRACRAFARSMVLCICRVAAFALLAISALIGLSAMSVFGVGPRPLISIPICTWLFNGSFELMRGLSFGARAALARHGVHLLVPPGDRRSWRAS